MRLTRSSLLNHATRAALGTTVLASAAQAGMVYDLRFADGSHGDIGGSEVVELWVRVSGTNGTTADEGLTSTYITIMSTQVSGGGIIAGGLTSGALAPGFNEAGSRNGAPNDLNGDGIIDWGATVTASANTNYMLARNATVGGALGGGTLGQAVDANTWEFKIATFTLNVAAYGTGVTYFNVVQPNAKSTVGTFTYATGRMDNTTFSITSSNTQGAYTGSQGIFTPIPEPASTSLLGAAALGLLARRRR